MVQKSKIDSNITGLAYAEEVYLGVLPGEKGEAGTPQWRSLEPNSYGDFGGEIVTIAPNPINPSRQRKKGVTVDLNASGSINHNLSFYNLMDIMQGVMFADTRQKGTVAVTGVDDSGDPDIYEVDATAGFFVGALIKGTGFSASANNRLNVVTAVTADTSIAVADGRLVEDILPSADAMIKVVGVRAGAGDLDVVVSGDLPVITSTTLDFTTLGLVPGQWVFIGGDAAGTGFTTEANNGYKRVRAITANSISFDKSSTTMSAEASGSETIEIYFGDVLKNELGELIKRRSYNIERTLGAPDTASTAQQSEVLIGSVPNEVTFNFPQAELINVDLGFVSIDNAQRTAAEGPKQSNVKAPISADIYNSSSDVPRMRMSIIDPLNPNPDALFAYLTEATIVINNNVSPNKAIGVLGAFDVTAGTFQVSGSLTAYFATVEATKAVRDNASVTLDVILSKDNQGLVIDLPLVSLGDGRIAVEQDEPISLPLNMDAATAVDIDPNLDYTAMFTFFHYLPTVAD